MCRKAEASDFPSGILIGILQTFFSIEIHEKFHLLTSRFFVDDKKQMAFLAPFFSWKKISYLFEEEKISFTMLRKPKNREKMQGE